MSKAINQNGAFRRKKVYFSQVSNVALRDKNLSLKAKGLYAIISSYITLEDFVLYKDYLISLSSDKKDGFNRVWDELKANGYLVQHTVRNDMGQYIYEYELLDEPRELSEEEREAFEKKEANRIARNKRKQANRKAKANPQTEIPPMEKEQKSIDGNSTNGASSDGDTASINNTELNNTDINNTDLKTTTTDVVIDDEVINEYNRYFDKKPTTMIKKKLAKYLEKFEVDAVTFAFEIASNKAKDFDYVIGILNNWIKENLYTFDAVYEYSRI